jgi:hypothetical protein
MVQSTSHSIAIHEIINAASSGDKFEMHLYESLMFLLVIVLSLKYNVIVTITSLLQVEPSE